MATDTPTPSTARSGLHLLCLVAALGLAEMLSLGVPGRGNDVKELPAEGVPSLIRRTLTVVPLARSRGGPVCPALDRGRRR